MRLCLLILRYSCGQRAASTHLRSKWIARATFPGLSCYTVSLHFLSLFISSENTVLEAREGEAKVQKQTNKCFPWTQIMKEFNSNSQVCDLEGKIPQIQAAIKRTFFPCSVPRWHRFLKAATAREMTRQISKQSGGHVEPSCFKATLTFGAVTQAGQSTVGLGTAQLTDAGVGLATPTMQKPGLSQKSGGRNYKLFFLLQGSEGYESPWGKTVWNWQYWTTFTYVDGSTQHIPEMKRRELILKYWCNNPHASLNQSNEST